MSSDSRSDSRNGNGNGSGNGRSARSGTTRSPEARRETADRHLAEVRSNRNHARRSVPTQHRASAPSAPARRAAPRGGATPLQRRTPRPSAPPSPPRVPASRGRHDRRVPARGRSAAHQRPLQRRVKRMRTRRPGMFRAGQPRRRLIALFIGSVLVFTGILFRVTMLQTAEARSYTLAGTNQRTQETKLAASRGVIFDRNGDELALSVPATTIIVNPQLVTDPDGTAQVLAESLDLSPERQQNLADAMRDKTHTFVYVARQLDQVTAASVLDLHLAGIDSYREDTRVVPGGDLAKSVIGRTDIDGTGISGLELQYDKILTGTDGERITEHDTHGNAIPGSGAVSVPAVPGTDLVLTLDRAIQFSLEQALLAQVSQLRARGGTAIVEETGTGNILAMASVRRDDQGVYHVTSANIAAVDCYEPGSVAKVVTTSAGINEGTVTPDTTFLVPYRKTFDAGTQWEHTIHDAEQHPDEQMTVRKILVDSSNIGTIAISQSIGYQKQWEYMNAFGLGQRTALAFPGESKGILKNWKDWQGTERITPAYGYGVCLPAIQLVGAVNVVANDGVYVAPRLVQSTIGEDGTLTDVAPADTHRVLTSATAQQMNLLMRDVVCDGTGSRAQVDGITIAGKTGTGVKNVDGKYGQEGADAKYYSSFVGFFPAEAPRVTTLISVDEPEGGDLNHFGGTAAAPVFQAVVPTIMHQLGIQPPNTTGGCPKT